MENVGDDGGEGPTQGHGGRQLELEDVAGSVSADGPEESEHVGERTRVDDQKDEMQDPPDSIAYWKSVAAEGREQLDFQRQETTQQLHTLLQEKKDAEKVTGEREAHLEAMRVKHEQELKELSYRHNKEVAEVRQRKQKEIGELVWEANRVRHENKKLKTKMEDLNRLAKDGLLPVELQSQVETTLRIRIEHLQREKLSLYRAFSKLEEENKSFKTIMDNLDEENISLQTTVDNLDEETRLLRLRQSGLVSMGDELLTENDSLTDRIAELKAEAKYAEDRMVIVHREVSEALDLMRQQRDEALTKLRDVDGIVTEEVRKVVDEMEEAVAELKEEVDRAESSIIERTWSPNPPRSQTRPNLVLAGRVTKRTPSILERFRNCIGW